MIICDRKINQLKTVEDHRVQVKGIAGAVSSILRYAVYTVAPVALVPAYRRSSVPAYHRMRVLLKVSAYQRRTASGHVLPQLSNNLDARNL